MKRYASTLVLFTLILSTVVLSSCKKEEIDPDLSKVFVGKWTGELNVENGYDYKTDLDISRVSDNSVKVTSTYNFIARDPQYTSETTTSVVDNIVLTTTVANSVTMNIEKEITVPGDVLMTKEVGIVTGRTLTIKSTGTYKKTGKVVTPPTRIYTRQ